MPKTPDTPILKRKPTNAAREILRENAGSMINQLLALTSPIKRDSEGKVVRCPACGRGALRDERVMLSAITAALDRAGIGPHQTVEVEHGDDNISILEYLTESQLAQVIGWVEEAQARQAANEGSSVAIEEAPH